MSGLNKAEIIGRLGQDVELKYTPSGKAVANISVATSESWKDQQGQKQERTTWHNIVIFGKLAEVAGQYLRKGSQAYFEGKLITEKYQDQQGADRYVTKIYANNMLMLDGKQDNQQPTQKQPQQRPTQQQQNQLCSTPSFDDFDDEVIPF